MVTLLTLIVLVAMAFVLLMFEVTPLAHTFTFQELETQNVFPYLCFMYLLCSEMSLCFPPLHRSLFSLLIRGFKYINALFFLAIEATLVVKSAIKNNFLIKGSWSHFSVYLSVHMINSTIVKILKKSGKFIGQKVQQPQIKSLWILWSSCRIFCFN